MADMEVIMEYLEAAYYIVVILGLPIAVFQYINTKLKEQRLRDYATYDALDEKYIEYQHLCLQHPDLDIFDVPDAKPIPLNDQQRKEELISLTLLMSIFERAYLMYHGASDNIRKRQWSGWKDYIHGYCLRPNFRSAWLVSGKTFDTKYQRYVNEVIRRTAGN